MGVLAVNVWRWPTVIVVNMAGASGMNKEKT